MADPNTTPVDRVRIFNPDGFPLCEFRTNVQRSWVIGDEGRALFTLASRKTELVNDTVLRFGNWLLVENSALPAWVGVLDTPRNWSSRTVTVCAYTPEHVFGWRRGPLEEVLTGSAGTIFEKLLGYVNLSEMTILRVGDIFRGGTQRQETINPTSLNRDLKRLQERSLEEYQWRPIVDPSGRLFVYADWLSLLGIDTSFILHEGKSGGNVEASDRIMVEDGPIYNDVMGYGDSMSWQSKPFAVAKDNESIGKYTLRQISKGYSGVADPNTLLANASAHLAAVKDANRVFRLNAINIGDTFKYMSLGNRMGLRFENMGFMGSNTGFQTRIRILGMAYEGAQPNKINLTVEERLV